MRDEADSADLPEDIGLGPVELLVTDPGRSVPLWRDVLGLRVLSDDRGAVTLGAGAKALIVLRAGADGPAPPKALGLFHVALHVPGRLDLAQVAARLHRAGQRHSAQDHLISEALYLDDPDGHGIEIAFDTPERGRIEVIGGEAVGIGADGQRHSILEPLDPAVLRALVPRDRPVADALPEAAFVGHIHFRTLAPERQLDFYTRVLGFRPRPGGPAKAFFDVGTRGRPHTVAFNMWGGAGVARPPPGAARVLGYTVELPRAETIGQIAARLSAAGTPHALDRAAGLECADPEGNRILFRHVPRQ